MKLWNVEVIQPKKTDRRRARFRIVYTVYAKTEKAAEKAIRKTAYVSDRDTVGRISPSDSVVFNPRYFAIAADADV